jgi:hypothetical protein
MLHVCMIRAATTHDILFLRGVSNISYIIRDPAKEINMVYAFFWVIPRRLNFICRRFGTLCLFHLHKRVGMKKWIVDFEFFIPTRLWRRNRQSVPKRRHVKFRRRGISQKKAYTIQNTAKIWNQEWIWVWKSSMGINWFFHSLRMSYTKV